MTAAGGQPRRSTFDVEAYAAALAASAPPLTADQLDELGDIVRMTVPALPRSPRRRPKQLHLTIHQEEPKLPGDRVHADHTRLVDETRDFEKHHIAETG